ncbi:MAG: hypothetical protein IH584_00380 [Candidatus Aminicenantes bacterium]|nr:hypothetical protein [Candidatus Aminicenantes bacterium]
MKKNQRMIALFVIFTFLSLLHISSMPLRAEQSSNQAGPAIKSPGQAPSFIEEEGDNSSPAKKKSILPIILIGVGVAAVAAVLFLVVLKTKYDITGAWTLTWKYEDEDQNSNTITFSGDKKTGSFNISSSVGTYTVDAKKVQWIYSDGQTIYTGEFTDKTHMSGTMISYGYNGTWSAVKMATTASIGTPAAVDKTANGEKQK